MLATTVVVAVAEVTIVATTLAVAVAVVITVSRSVVATTPVVAVAVIITDSRPVDGRGPQRQIQFAKQVRDSLCMSSTCFAGTIAIHNC